MSAALQEIRVTTDVSDIKHKTKNRNIAVLCCKKCLKSALYVASHGFFATAWLSYYDMRQNAMK